MVKKTTAAVKKRDPSARAKKKELRERAAAREARLGPPKKMSLRETHEVVHELRVHQIELEMQNDELRKAQTEIEESRSRYVDLYDFAPVGYLTLGRASVIREVNLTVARLLGTPRRDLTGKIFTQYIAPGHLDAFLHFKSNVLRSQARQVVELELVKWEGSRFWASLEGIAFKAEGESIPNLRCSLSDITERRIRERQVTEKTAQLAEANVNLRAEMERRRSAEQERLRLEAAANQAAEGMVITDPRGTILYVNPAFAGEIGLAKERLIGLNYLELLKRDAGDLRIEELLSDDNHLGLGWNLQITRRRPDGSAREFDVASSPIKDGEGKVVNFLAIERDVTEQRRLNQYIQRWQKMESLGTMAGGIAHDLNNILTPIVINMELAQLELPEDSPLKSYVDTSLGAAQRGKELVGQIITFSRQKELARESLRVGPIISEILGLLAPSLPKSVALRQKIQRGQDTVLADPGQIHQLVMNIFNNAITAMRESGGVLEVGLAPVEIEERQALDLPDLRPGPHLKLTVRDTGTGMSTEVLEKAFDPFFTTKRPGEGAGMGLAVVASIVKTLRGEIIVNSRPGEGSVFEVYLPRAAAAAERQRKGGKTIAGGTERVLIVEDDRIQVETLKKALEKLGYVVKGMDNSADALALFKQNPADFDLVVTDQTMPGLTGIRLAEEIFKVRPDIPIILCTGFSEEVDLERKRVASIAKFLMKPFSIREMAGAIRQALRGT